MAESQRPANGNGRQPLAQAPEADPPPAQTPLNYRAEFLFETAEGFHVLMVGEQLTPRDCMVWVRNASKELEKQGFKPVRRDLVVNVPVAAAAAGGAQAQAAGGTATLIPAEGNKPPRCSAHGALRFIEGTYKAGHPRAGQHFEFWGCTNRECKVRA